MKMYYVKNEKKNVIGLVEENGKLSVSVDFEVFENVFEKSFDALMLEVEMIIDGLDNEVEKFVEFVNDDENDYVVYLNKERYEFDF